MTLWWGMDRFFEFRSLRFFLNALLDGTKLIFKQAALIQKGQAVIMRIMIVWQETRGNGRGS